jgi:hypothetical protein
LISRRSRLTAAMTYRVAQAKTQPADKQQPNDQKYLHASAQREFCITLGLGRLSLFPVKDSSHAPSFYATASPVLP